MLGSGPLLAIPTKRGSVPSLTPAQASAILEPAERILATSVFEATDFVKACTESGMSLSAYCGLGEYKTVLTVRSAFHGPHASASSTDAAVAGDNEKGRTVVSMDKWREVVEATQPCIAVAPYDSYPLCEPLSRRRRVAATRSETWLGKTEGTAVAGCTVLPCVSATAEHDCGYVDAAPRGENAFELFQSLQALQLSPTKCSMCVAPTIGALLVAMVSHVTLIECPLPWVLAEKGIALVLCDDTVGAPLLDLNDNVYTLDINPIAEQCDCFTCRRHCRAYLHHLLTVQEMNSDILLVMHNLTQVVQLVRAYRLADAPAREALVRCVASAL